MARAPRSPGALSADARIALFYGKELFLHAEYTARLRDALKERFGEVEVFRFDGQSAQAADVLDECRSFGLIQQHKMVIVDDANLLIRGGVKDDKDGKSPRSKSRDDEESEEDAAGPRPGPSTRPLFERYAQAPTDSATLVLRARTFTPGKLGPLIEKVGVVIKCDAETPAEARRWVLENAPVRHGVRVDPAAADLLVERIGPDLGRLDSEVAKLAAAIGAPRPDPAAKPRALPTVTADTAAELVGITREEDLWSIKDALLSGNPQATLKRLHAILYRGPRGQEVPVMWAALDAARQVHALANGLRQGRSAPSLAGSLKIWPPFRADAMAAVARRLGPARAAALLAAAVEADRRSKSGLGDWERNLERLSLRFASAVR